MDKTSMKAAIMSALSEEIDMWLDKESKITDGYEYEDEFMHTARKVNQILLTKSLGSVSSNRNKKNSGPVLARSK